MSQSRKDKKTMKKDEISMANMLDIANKTLASVEPAQEVRMGASLVAQMLKAYLDEGIPYDAAVKFISAMLVQSGKG